MSNILKQRREWFEEYTRRVEQGVTTPLRPGVRYSCPCCGYPTLSERGGYDICELCDWEDDGQDAPEAEEVWGGPNGAYSLSEARMNFRRHLIMYGPDKPTHRVGGNTNSPLEHQTKCAIMEAFDSMVREPDPSALNAIWQRVFDSEGLLKRERERRIREHEARMKGRGSPTA